MNDEQWGGWELRRTFRDQGKENEKAGKRGENSILCHRCLENALHSLVTIAWMITGDSEGIYFLDNLCGDELGKRGDKRRIRF